MSENSNMEPPFVPLGGGWRSSWMYQLPSEADPDNPHAGWYTVRADAITGKIETDDTGGGYLTPAEAVVIARAHQAAVAHVESYWHTVLHVLDDEQGTLLGPEFADFTVEQRQAVNRWIGVVQAHAVARRPKGHADTVEGVAGGSR